MGAFQGKKILLGVSGSVAAYKAVELASRMTHEGAEVTAVLTAAARRFVAPLAFAAVTHRRAFDDLWADAAEGAPAHIELANAADLFFVAPASADILAKFAHGLADDLLSCAYLATRAPVLLAPAMNCNMYAHPAMQANLAVLKSRGHTVIEPAVGTLACGATGKGRLPDTEVLVRAAQDLLS